MKIPNKIILSRTDNIGDVVLTLPLAGLLKQQNPDCEISFLARNYVKDVVVHCDAVDHFIDWEALKSQSTHEIAKQLQADAIIHVFPNKKIAQAAKIAKIPHRIGSNRRLFHWLSCNHLVNFSRKNSTRHEAQLNLNLLKPFNLEQMLNLETLAELLSFNLPPAPAKVLEVIDPQRFTLIIHPGTHGHTREWSTDHFKKLINALPKDKIQVLLTGTQQEQDKFQTKLLDQIDPISNLMGQFSLQEFIQLIANCDALLAGSTGPTHLAGMLDKPTIGLYPPCRGMSPQRWAPLGKNTNCVLGRPACHRCDDQPLHARCMMGISVDEIHQLIIRIANV